MSINKDTQALKKDLHFQGIRILTLNDFKWMDNIPKFITPFQTFHDCLVPVNGDMLYHASGEPIRPSLHIRGYDQTIHGPANYDHYPADGKDISTHLKTVIFIPFLDFVHIGHFITESISWLAAFLDPRLDQFIRSEQQPTILLGKDAANYRDDLALLLKIDPENILCTGSLHGLTHIETVFLPERTMINKCYITNQHFQAVKSWMDMHVDLQYSFAESNTIFKSDIPKKEKIYLSRSRLPTYKRHILGEIQIEQYLAANGWQIVYPEELSVRDQIEVLKHARVISGNAGTAFHLLMYLGQNLSSKRVITLGSKSEILENLGPNNVFAQLKAQHINVFHLAAYCEPSTISKGPGVGRRQLDLEIIHPPVLVAEAIESIASAF